MKKLFTIGLLLLCQLMATAQSNDYDPNLPDHPGQSGWDPTTGALVVTWFTPGQLASAIQRATNDEKGYSHIEKIRSLTVSGKANNTDMVRLSSLKPYLRLLDLSRTDGITQVDEAFFKQDTVMHTLLLPASIERILSGAFSNSPRLENVTCYATTPPKMTGIYAFNECHESLTVFVPAESLPLYAEADGWKDMNLMPITQGVHALTVNLPFGANMQQLKDLFLELANVKTGQSQRLVITNRTQYTFTNLIEGTLYNIYIRNARGDVFATVKDVEIAKADVQVPITDLKQPRDLTLQLFAPDGSPVGTDAFAVTWTDLAGNFLAKGATLPGQMEGAKTIARIRLGEQLGTQYLQPADTTIVVGNMGTMGIRLTPLPQTELSGTVTAAATGLPIRSANIAVTQQLNGLYPVTLTTTTDKDGQWTLTAYDAPTTVTMQATGYIPQTVTLESLPLGGRLEGALRDLAGTAISLDLSYRPAVREGEIPDVNADYNGYQNLTYAVYDETHQQELTNIQQQGDRLILQDQQLAEGTRLRITATSPTGDIAPATATCTVSADGTATATLPLVQLGQLKATFSQTDNPAVVGMLYDADGQLLSRSRYTTANATSVEGEIAAPTLWLGSLPDGQYTLVTMGESQLFNGVNTLAALTEMNLEEGRDYLKNTVDIQAGRIDSLHNQLVPMMDETVFYYTTDQTHFTANKTSLTVGNYVTLRAEVDFKPGVTPDELSLLFDLPEGCQLVEGSVMAGNSLAEYETDGNRLTVPVKRASDVVRFCVMPTKEGYYEPTASVAFTPLGGTGRGFQPLGSAGFTAEALSITAQERVSNGRVMVSGTAIAGSDVQIFEGDQLIGHTEAGPEGSWSMRCSLVRPYNLSQHYVYAVITTPDGLTLQTDVETVTVSHGTVTPVVYASNGVTTGIIKWDFRDFTVTPKHNAWPLGPGTLPFTFKVDFYNEDNVMVNDTTIISDVVLYVLRSDDRYVTLNAPYNKESHKWIAQCDFDIDASPKNICVDFLQNETILSDRQQMDDQKDDFIQTITEHQQMLKEAYDLAYEEIVPVEDPESALQEELMQLFDIENPDEATLARINELMELLYPDGIETVEDPVDLEDLPEYVPITQEEREGNLNRMLSLLSAAMSTDTISTELGEAEMQKDIQLANGVIHYTAKRVTSINEQALLSEGYDKSELTDGNSIYYLNTGTKEAYLDSRDMMHIILEWEEGATAAARSDRPRKSSSKWDEMDIRELFDQAEMENLKSIDHKLWELLYRNPSQSPNALTQAYLGQGRALCKELYISANKLYKGGLENINTQLNHIYWNNRDEYNAKIDSLKWNLKKWRTRRDNCNEIMRKNPGLKTNNPKYYTELVNIVNECNHSITNYDGDIKYYNDQLKKNESDYNRICRNIVWKLPKDLITTNSYRVNLGCKYENSPIGMLYYLQICFYTARNTYDDLGEWQKTYNNIRAKIPCEGNEEAAIELMTRTLDAIVGYGGEEITDSWSMSGSSKIIYSKFMEDFTPEQRMPLSWYLAGHDYNLKDSPFYKDWEAFLFKCDQSNMLNFYYNETKQLFSRSEKERKRLNKLINDLKCEKKKPDPEEEEGTRPFIFRIRWSPFFGIDFYHDPSGYVYEAVSSNRLEGVRATCYYKETGEDMYGDLYEREVVWNAEEYAQENPLFTDAEGKYRWDVPQGLWQVRYEKDGYEPKRSEWLPVPPPQLEVNVGMTQLRQPAVKKVKAYTDGIEITFDKYMRPLSISPEGEGTEATIIVTKDGKVVPGRIELLNADSGYETPDSVYASKVRFNVNADLNLNDKVMLTVKKAVESYAGLQMEQDFQQEFDVEQRIEAIVVDSILYMAEGTEQTLTVRIEPAEAAKGKQLKAVSLDEGVVTVSPSLGDGLGWVLTARSLGSSAVRFSLTDDDELTVTTLVHVRDTASMYVYAPRASRMSGTEVYRGAEIKLTTQTAGATILYTLDGTCPCDENNPAVLTYRGPIAANGTELHIKAMAVANGMAESDVAEFRYKVIDNIVGIQPIDNSQLTTDNSAKVYYRLDGRRTAKPQKGLNIVRQENGTVKKILVK